ncbi:predicted protein [Naegleria gruberi]|uniref:Predicted protein n=1 Tax=Naegleria gruberi TaxID=5762 RepID=D2W201_NAEGR|nr:uncharacterized protein NAEGRDRAFT_75409 [Naegleria gruberi]EFC36903.1 predicted protein [Naegleria gruberi]|eukprot:XP_002669647.1 predicted protein [Naegleria gruberi strain NEG-M]
MTITTDTNQSTTERPSIDPTNTSASLDTTSQQHIPTETCTAETTQIHSKPSNSFFTPKTKFILTIVSVTAISFLLAFILISMTITFAICDSLFDFPDLENGIYALLVAISILFLGIGIVTLIVGWRLWRGKYSVNDEGFVVNSRGDRINVLGDVKNSDDNLVTERSSSDEDNLRYSRSLKTFDII